MATKSRYPLLSQFLQSGWLEKDYDGYINEGHFKGFYLKLFLIMARDSSWDFPAAIMALHNSLPEQFQFRDETYGIFGEELPMHPDNDVLSLLQAIDSNFTEDDLQFDT